MAKNAKQVTSLLNAMWLLMFYVSGVDVVTCAAARCWWRSVYLVLTWWRMLQPAVDDILSKLSSGSWSDRRDGLVMLQSQLQSHRRLSSVFYLSLTALPSHASHRLSLISQLPNDMHGTSGTPIEYVILFCCWSVWVCSFIELDLSDTDNIVPFENTTPINLINFLCIFFYFDLFSLINRSGIFKQYNVVIVK